MNTTFVGLELRRVLRDYVSMFFIAVLPAFFYVIFGAAQDFSDERAGNGNVAMYIMISMAAYGAVTATTGIGGMAAVERMQGWGRQLGLTPLADSSYVAMKAGVALAHLRPSPWPSSTCSALLTSAEGSAAAWAVSAVLVLLGAGVFAIYGLAVGLAFRSEAAVERGQRSAGHHGVPGQHLHPAHRDDADHRQVHSAVRVRRARPVPAHRGLTKSTAHTNRCG